MNFIDLLTHASLQSYTAAGVGILVAVALFKPFFGDLSGFAECVRYWLCPDFISLFQGEWGEDQWSELKLFLWAALSVGCAVWAYYQLPGYFPAVFAK